jgi:hypothetical protein
MEKELVVVLVILVMEVVEGALVVVDVTVE